MKRVIIPLTLLSLVPSALAQDQGLFGSAFSLIFGPVGNAGNDMVLKVGLWLAMIFVLFQGAQKIFKNKDATGTDMPNKKIAILFAILISTIAVRFMPPEWAAGLGTLTWISVVILLPYTLISFVTDNKWAKIIGTGAVVLLMTLFLSSYGAPTIFPFIRGSRFLSDIFYLLTPQYYLMPLIFAGVVIIIMFIFFASKGAGEAGSGGGSKKSGFWDYMAARKAAKAATRQTRIETRGKTREARHQRRAEEAQAWALARQAEEQRKAAIEQARLQNQPQAQQKKPGLIKKLFRKFGEGAIKNLTTPTSPEVKIAQIKAQAAREKAERERLAAQAATPKPQKLSWLQRRRQAKAERQATKQNALLYGSNDQPLKMEPIKPASWWRRKGFLKNASKSPEFSNQTVHPPQQPRNSPQQVKEALHKLETGQHATSQITTKYQNPPHNIPSLSKSEPIKSPQSKPYNRNASYIKAMKKIKELEKKPSILHNASYFRTFKQRREDMKKALPEYKGRIGFTRPDISEAKNRVKQGHKRKPYR